MLYKVNNICGNKRDGNVSPVISDAGNVAAVGTEADGANPAVVGSSRENGRWRREKVTGEDETSHTNLAIACPVVNHSIASTVGAGNH